jgi:dihydrofolate synthase/folylpolyglutamate synthase
MKINTYQEALNYILKTIPKGKNKFPGDIGIKRQKLLFEILGNPQNKIKVIHVAGTSGKGSVVTYISRILTGHGFKVGTTISPHIIDIRERIQINNEFINKDEFVLYINQIIPAIEKCKKAGMGNPTYFEIMIALAFYVFFKKGVDYAIVETGMGGLLDGTNTVDNKDKIAVITRIGFDHMSILGKRITDIAYQKAGIIQDHNPVVTLWQTNKIRGVIDKFAKNKLTEVSYLKRGKNIKNVITGKDGIRYDFIFQDLVLKNLNLNNFAQYQVENSALALAVVKILSVKYGFDLNIETIRKAIYEFRFAGRMEIIKKGYKTLILDGAHNPQKMKSFINSLNKAFPGEKFTFLIAFKQRKDFSKMLKMIIPMASNFVFTSFIVKYEDMIQLSEPPKDMVNALEKLNFRNYKVILNPEAALKKVLQESDKIVVTSSLYLLSRLYPCFQAITKTSGITKTRLVKV